VHDRRERCASLRPHNLRCLFCYRLRCLMPDLRYFALSNCSLVEAPNIQNAVALLPYLKPERVLQIDAQAWSELLIAKRLPLESNCLVSARHLPTVRMEFALCSHIALCTIDSMCMESHYQIVMLSGDISSKSQKKNCCHFNSEHFGERLASSCTRRRSTNNVYYCLTCSCC
jgi:hypothetical protein